MKNTVRQIKVKGVDVIYSETVVKIINTDPLDCSEQMDCPIMLLATQDWWFKDE